VGDLVLRVSPNNGIKGGCFCALRPEDIHLAVDDGRAFDNLEDCRIATIDGQGFYFRVSLDVSGTAFYVFWTRETIGRNDLKPGDRVKIGFSEEAVHLIRGGSED
jgi:hypothetical protein